MRSAAFPNSIATICVLWLDAVVSDALDCISICNACGCKFQTQLTASIDFLKRVKTRTGLEFQRKRVSLRLHETNYAAKRSKSAFGTYMGGSVIVYRDGRNQFQLRKNVKRHVEEIT